VIKGKILCSRIDLQGKRATFPIKRGDCQLKHQKHQRPPFFLGGAIVDYLTLGFLAFGLVVLIGFVIVLTDKGLKWKKK